MIILHAGLEDGHLLLWGEGAADEQTPTAPRRRQPNVPRPRSFPFDPGSERLAAAIADALPDTGKPPLGSEQRFLWLPTIKNRPVPSSVLVAETPEPGATAVLAPWSVAILRLSFPQTIALLCACANRETLAPGVVVGATLAYWVWALRFAGVLVAREQFVPDVRQAGHAWQARWRPVLAGRDAQSAPRRWSATGRRRPSVSRPSCLR